MFSRLSLTIFVIFIFFNLNLSYGLTDQQIQLSQQAIKDLNKKNYHSYYCLKSKLKDTSIYSYLQYKEISLAPSIFEQSTIADYYQKNKGQYWLLKLSDDLATYYAKNNDWQLFNKYYRGGLGVAGKCWNIQAKYDLGDKIQALNEYGQLWQNRLFMPSACSKMQGYWNNYHSKSEAHVVTKAYILSFANKFNDALWLLNTYVRNNSEYINYIMAWREAIKDPNKLDGFIYKFHSYKKFDDIFVHISKTLIKKDTEGYAEVWNNLKNKKYLSDKNKHHCISKIAVSFARSKSPQAKQWFAKVDKKYLDAVAWEWLLRLDLYNGNFEDYIKTYGELPKKYQQNAAWKYWLAYSYKELGQQAKATLIFKQLIKKPLEYYSFLAADELVQPYNFGDKDYGKLNSQDANLLSKDQSVSQAVDLYNISQHKDSIELWKWIVRNELKNNQKEKINKLAQFAAKNNMHYAAIFNMAVTGEYSNINLLFPKAFLSEVNQNASKYKINRDLILSIMRKESLFEIEAKSSAGAKGLMQIRIPTAKFIVKKYKLSLTGGRSSNIDGQIFIPKNNIKIGTANLHFLNNLFHQNIILSIAAYNAGPGNVAKWLNNKEIVTSIWIENIPFGETRHYIRKVLVYAIVYKNFIFKSKKEKQISDYLNLKLSDKLSFK